MKGEGKKPVTVWMRPKVEVDSQYGHVTYETWCEKEAERMNSHGDSVKVRHDKATGEICVSR